MLHNTANYTSWSTFVSDLVKFGQLGHTAKLDEDKAALGEKVVAALRNRIRNIYFKFNRKESMAIPIFSSSNMITIGNFIDQIKSFLTSNVSEREWSINLKQNKSKTLEMVLCNLVIAYLQVLRNLISIRKCINEFSNTFE